MHTIVLTPTLVWEDHAFESEHTARFVGPDTLQLLSCSPELSLELESVYLAPPGADEALCAESILIGGDDPRVSTHLIDGYLAGLVRSYPQLALLHHFARLASLSAEAGQLFRFDRLDETISELLSAVSGH